MSRRTHNPPAGLAHPEIARALTLGLETIVDRVIKVVDRHMAPRGRRKVVAPRAKPARPTRHPVRPSLPEPTRIHA